MKDSQLIFLISQPRSGSTLLQKLLGSHSKIYTRSEPWLMLYPAYSLKEEGVCTEYDFELGKSGLNDFLGGLPSGKQLYTRELHKMYLNLYSSYIHRTGYQYFLDKTPRYYLIHKELMQIFPNAKLVLLIRNPLAVISSVINTWTNLNWDDLSKFKHDLITAIDNHINIIESNDKRVHVIHYEQLISNTTQELGNIFSYLGIRYENTTQTYYNNNERWLLGDQINVYSKKGIDKNNDSKWQKRLKEPQYWRVIYDYLNYIGKERFEKIGYDFQESKLILEKNMPANSLQYIIDNTKSLKYLLGSNEDFFNIGKIRKVILENKKEIEKIKLNLSDMEKKVSERNDELARIYSSDEWRLIIFLRKFLKLILPKRSLRRNVLGSILKIFR